jgi:hypothetical protein
VLAKGEGLHDNAEYKRRVDDALPLGERCPVTEGDGTVLGWLIRHLDAQKPRNLSGNIRCEKAGGIN